MYDVIFAFRADLDTHISSEEAVAAAEYILFGVQKDRIAYLTSIDEVIRPMCTLFAGLHCNIEALADLGESWPNYFKKNKVDTHQIPHIWTKRLAKNFVRVCFKLKG